MSNRPGDFISVSCRFSPEMLQAIEAFQEELQLESRSDAVRLLVTNGLERYVPPRHMTFEQVLIDAMKTVRSVRQAIKNGQAS